MSETPFIEHYVVDDDILVLKLHGSLDASKTDEFHDEVQKHLGEDKHRIIIDGSNLGYISSLGIGALMALESRLRKLGGAVKLCSLQGNLVDLLSIVRLDRVLGIYGDIQFAREAFAEEGQASTES